jgi:hypothetical protein
MSDATIDAEEAPIHYVPSGRVNFFGLTGLMMAGCLLSMAMALALLFCEERGFYFYFITPLVLGLPVLAATWAVVRWGKCRNRGLGGLIGIVLVFVYYAGYWELSYLTNIVARGPRVVAMVRKMSGLPGLPGYIVFRCKISRPLNRRNPAPMRRPPTLADAILNGLFFGGETLVIAVLGAGVGRTTASRAFSERKRRWTSRFEFRMPPTTAPVVLNALDPGDWKILADLPRVSSSGNAQTNNLLFRLEYIPGVTDEPAYVSVIGSNGGRARNLELQRWISPELLLQLAGEFPDLKLPKVAQPADVESPSPLQASLERMGLSTEAGTLDGSGGATSKADFRDRAVAASRSVLDRREPFNPRTANTSLCLPVSESGARELKMAGWRKLTVHILFFLGAFGSLLTGLAGSQLKDPKGKETALGRDLEIFGLIGFLTFDVLFLVFALGGDRVWKPFLAHRLRGHADSLLNEAEGLRSLVLRVEDARTYHRQKVAGEDLVIALLDPENRRIMLEGLSHRYVIRGADVTSFWPLQAHSVISIRIDYMIAEEKLALVLATTNPWFHFFHGAFASATVKRLVTSLSQALECEPHEETGGGPMATEIRPL